MLDAKRLRECVAAGVGSAVGGMVGAQVGDAISSFMFMNEFLVDRGTGTSWVVGIVASALGGVIGTVLGSYLLLRLLRAQYSGVTAYYVFGLFPVGIGLFSILLVLVPGAQDHFYGQPFGLSSAIVGILGRVLTYVRLR